MSAAAPTANVLVRRESSGTGITTLTLCDHERHNALSLPLIAQLSDHLSHAAADKSTRVVLIRAEGRSFCAGADMGWVRAILEQDMVVWEEAIHTMDALLLQLHRFEKPLIAQLHGNVIGAGVAITACCDVVVASAETRFFLPELRLGMVPSIIVPFIMARIGPAATRALLLLGESFDAKRAQELGMVQSIASGDGVAALAQTQAEACLKSPPQAVASLKRMLAALCHTDIDRQMQIIEAEAMVTPLAEEAKQGISAFLSKKRPPWVSAPD
ncbi:MAG: enoyl-CoA hydratase-related protein [Burkholderiaceae bacterium]|nr:enoyl-CoA hydratase-related protein [Desulfobacterales bacterium]MDP3137213.1 enoyl-CoA hydratase-related protein [Burkholderiaceae bacterium]